MTLLIKNPANSSSIAFKRSFGMRSSHRLCNRRDWILFLRSLTIILMFSMTQNTHKFVPCGCLGHFTRKIIQSNNAQVIKERCVNVASTTYDDCINFHISFHKTVLFLPELIPSPVQEKKKNKGVSIR